MCVRALVILSPNVRIVSSWSSMRQEARRETSSSGCTTTTTTDRANRSGECRWGGLIFDKKAAPTTCPSSSRPESSSSPRSKDRRSQNRIVRLFSAANPNGGRAQANSRSARVGALREKANAHIASAFEMSNPTATAPHRPFTCLSSFFPSIHSAVTRTWKHRNSYKHTPGGRRGKTGGLEKKISVHSRGPAEELRSGQI